MFEKGNILTPQLEAGPRFDGPTSKLTITVKLHGLEYSKISDKYSNLLRRT